MTSFSKALLEWHALHPRPMPWSETKDPYKIWLSEIILQQTRVTQGWAYFEKFVSHYPTVFDLAAASEDNILKDWQGLGYNSRARNLHASAKYIVEELDGQFPDTYEEILKLKGVGPYTASAISSFAFDLPYPVVDGNVKRICARFFGIQSSIDDSKTHQLIEKQALSLMGKHPSAIFNQAIMNFGALQCIPRNPDCSTCPVATDCKAFATGLQNQLPVRSVKKKREKRFFHYFMIVFGNQILLRKRVKKDIWQNMYELPMLEKMSKSRLSNIEKEAFLKELGIKNAKIGSEQIQYQQILTHRIIQGTFHTLETKKIPATILEGDYLVDLKNLKNFALPKIVRLYLKEQWSIN